MSLTLRVPALGESVQEATLGAWKRAEGDEVSADEPVAGLADSGRLTHDQGNDPASTGGSSRFM